jgi:beta-N-acetylhexosaminidase
MTNIGFVDRRLMLAFEGTTLSPAIAAAISNHNISGVTLFRSNNYETPAQLRTLTDALQLAAGGDLPILVAIDQEGGQLHAFGAPATMWPGNMALGAANDPELTRRVAVAIAEELLAVGINIDYAPVADLASNPRNLATGTRSFGESASSVAVHVAGFVEGLQSVGVAATMKHFPGKGAAAVDSHLGLPVLDHTENDLTERELVPFVAAVDAGVRLAMTGHVAIPAITGSDELPGTLSAAINTKLLRDGLGFDGVLISDALDMKALSQGIGQAVDVIAAIRSGVDLLLMTADPEQQERVTLSLGLATSRELISQARLEEADDRVTELRRWISAHDPPPISIIGCAQHAQLCLETATRSITLVKDDADLLPIHDNASLLVVETEPTVLTPADTSNYEAPHLADEISKAAAGEVAGIVVPHAPTATDILAVVEQAKNFDVIVVGTVAAHVTPSQGELVQALLVAHDAVIAIAQRTPWDFEAYPMVGTYVCAWSANRPSAQATAAALLGNAPISGGLPVSVGHFPIGHGMDRA